MEIIPLIRQDKIRGIIQAAHAAGNFGILPIMVARVWFMV
ncbi:putative membrane protein [Acinetobacter sp. 1294596]|jgi:hypothetical protein|nr:putative membrane protein [Acinetobacter sp. 1239920]EXF55969.1 putative membrane protein [Acinetobacter sp. 1294596]